MLTFSPKAGLALVRNGPHDAQGLDILESKVPYVPSAACGPVDCRVVQDNALAVLGHADVELDHVAAQPDRLCEGGQGVLRMGSARTAVGANSDVLARHFGCGAVPALYSRSC